MRRERGWTQAQFAVEVDVSPQYMQRVEAGAENLTVRSLVKFAVHLGVDVARLFEPPRSRAPRRAGRPKKA